RSVGWRGERGLELTVTGLCHLGDGVRVVGMVEPASAGVRDLLELARQIRLPIEHVRVTGSRRSSRTASRTPATVHEARMRQHDVALGELADRGVGRPEHQPAILGQRVDQTLRDARHSLRIEVDQDVATEDYIEAPDTSSQRRVAVLGKVEVAEVDCLAKLRPEHIAVARAREVPPDPLVIHPAQRPLRLDRLAGSGESYAREIRSEHRLATPEAE